MQQFYKISRGRVKNRLIDISNSYSTCGINVILLSSSLPRSLTDVEIAFIPLLHVEVICKWWKLQFSFKEMSFIYTENFIILGLLASFVMAIIECFRCRIAKYQIKPCCKYVYKNVFFTLNEAWTGSLYNRNSL